MCMKCTIWIKLPCLAFKLAGKRQTVNSYTFLNHVFTHFQFLNCCFADWKKMCSVHSIFFHQVVTRNKIIVFFFCVPNAYFFSRNEFEKCLETMSSFGTLSFFFFFFWNTPCNIRFLSNTNTRREETPPVWVFKINVDESSFYEPRRCWAAWSLSAEHKV